MSFGIGNLNQIVSDFKESLNQIFGLGSSGSPSPKGGSDLYNPKFGGVSARQFDATKWTGNARLPKSVRYGFAVVSASEASVFGPINLGVAYYLDIPPQSISQKEVFASNIQATRKGVIVESEGVVFKDITIQGTTGVFPGKRGSFNGPQANLASPFDAPKSPSGVDSETGRSKDSQEKVVSGYEEFLGLRQYFLKFAYERTQKNGDLFLVFLNEKDNQSLIVEPLEFNMERSSKSPMTYNYKIVLKCIGNLAQIFSSKSSPNATNIFDKIGNFAGNLSAAIGQGRAAINATSTAFRKTFQAIDQTINGPLLQLQMAIDDLAAGISQTLSLPSLFLRNFNNALPKFEKFKSLESQSAQLQADYSNKTGTATRTLSAQLAANTAASSALKTELAPIQASSRVSIPRSFVEKTRQDIKSQAENIADSLNLGDPLYDTIKGRVVTESPGPLKVASDEEFLLLGNVQTMSDVLNQILVQNDSFESDAEKSFESARQAFENPTAPQSQQLIALNKPDFVREVVIRRGDTLERLAQRELGSAHRWTELAILNNLKPPYISDAGGDAVKKPGERLLVGTN